MQLEQLVDIMDEKDIGDPALVEDLERSIEDFRDDLDQLDDETAVYLVGTASLFRDGVGAYELLRRSLPLISKAGQMRRLYEQQLKVWQGRKDKSQHDLEYLQIVLGVKDRRPEPPADEKEAAKEETSDDAVETLLKSMLSDDEP